jgi:hypothetical protein
LLDSYITVDIGSNNFVAAANIDVEINGSFRSPTNDANFNLLQVI